MSKLLIIKHQTKFQIYRTNYVFSVMKFRKFKKLFHEKITVYT